MKTKHLLIIGIISLLVVSNIMAFENSSSKNSTPNSSYNLTLNSPHKNEALIPYNEYLYILVKNDTAYVKDIINGTGNPYCVKSAGIILYEKIYGYNYSKLLYKNTSHSILFYYNFSISKINNTLNITIPVIEDYVGTLGGSIRLRSPPENIKVLILAENKLAETNGKYILEYNKTSKNLVSLIYLTNISNICEIHHTKFFNTSNFFGYAIINITSIKDNGSSYLIKNYKGNFTFNKKYDIFISNSTAYLVEPHLYVKFFKSTIDDVIVLDNQSNPKNQFPYSYLVVFFGIIAGFGIIGLAIYLSKKGR
ncbi:hypothetical protein [Methanocaldococcus sp.]